MSVPGIRGLAHIYAKSTATLRHLLNQRAKPLNKRLHTVVATASALAVVVATLWAWQSSELTFAELTWWPIVIAFVVMAPASLALKSTEYQISARLVSQQPSQSRSLKVAVVSAAANLLPLPGSMIVTVRSLSEDGSNYGSAISAGAVPGVAWLSLTGLIGGTAIVIEGQLLVGGFIVLAGLIAGIAAWKLFQTATAHQASSLPLALSVVGVEVAWLMVSALRLALAVTALGVSITPTQALALSVAGALTVAIGFFPGGLGLREALLAALSPLIGLEFNTGVLLGALDRLIWLSFLAIASGVLLATSGKTWRSQNSSIN